MASIESRKNKDGIITSYRVKVYDKYTDKSVCKTIKASQFDGWSKKRIDNELNKIAAKLEIEHEKGVVAPVKANITLSEYCYEVIEQKYSMKSIKLGTRDRYLAFMKRINSTDFGNIGAIPLKQLRSDHIKDFYTKLSQPGVNEKSGGCLSPKTIKEYHLFITMVLSQAEDDELVFKNVGTKAGKMLPKAKQKPVEIFEHNETEMILQALQNEDLKWQALILTMLDGALRVSECIALTWNDVSYNDNTISINKIVVRTNESAFKVDSPKTDNGVRVVTLTKPTMDILQAWKEEQQTRREIQTGFKGINTWCFNGQEQYTHEDNYNKPLTRTSVTDFLDRLAKKNNFDFHLNPHKFRHTSLSYLNESGQNIVAISQRAGHSDPSFTAKTYLHTLEDTDKKSAEMLEQALFGVR